ncbi:MAG TPA: SDR family NAD(P)-dependent oxidoreductase [Candidatus Angelobacter sp.]|nr:SDR family NAD(P)-dependent oxidoreductase [Candidatus Angelobacter sp.]
MITGASGGLGTVVTEMFLDEGYRVSAVALDWPRKPVRSSSCMVIDADLISCKEAESVVKKILAKWGTIDCLAHLVGAFMEGERTEKTSDAVWNKLLDVNLKTAVNMLRAVIPCMQSQKQESITVIGSSAGLHPVTNWSAFNASIAGLCALVRTASAELQEEGVTVNALLPTTIDTPEVRKMCGDTDAHKWVNPRSLGSLMLWLDSEAGRDVTGAIIPVVGRQKHPCYEWHGSIG